MKETTKKIMSLSRSQVRGICLLLPIILIVILLASLISRAKVEDDFLTLSDTVAVEKVKLTKIETQKEPQKEIKLFDFDPNTIDYRGLRNLGFSSSQAAGIIKFRTTYNKTFELATDFATLYQVSDSMFYALEPYIKIPARETKPTKKQSAKPEVQAPKKVDINTATPQQLDSLPGIGELTANRIVEYGKKLGGYSKIEQVLEVEGVLKKNYLKFCEEIFVKNDCISKIDINFAGAEIMSVHPYMEPIIIRKVLKHRQLKGGLGNITEMIEAHILTEQQAEKLADYLVFNTQTDQ